MLKQGLVGSGYSSATLAAGEPLDSINPNSEARHGMISELVWVRMFRLSGPQPS
jgi:hypothetical protein